QLKCTSCGYCSNKLESSTDLSSNLEKMGRDRGVKKFRSLHTASKSFMATEALSAGDERKCGGCEKLVVAEKTLSVRVQRKLQRICTECKRF
ncbi:unnamed protein product, partial [Hapterophycus canaliculatus]